MKQHHTLAQGVKTGDEGDDESKEAELRSVF